MNKMDYYKVLGISNTATADEIRAAYRKLARKYHPDLNPGDKQATRKFQEINEANEVLSDLKKRKEYDRYFSKAQSTGTKTKTSTSRNSRRKQRRAADFADDGFSFFESFTTSEFFSDATGDSRTGRKKKREKCSSDYEDEIHLTTIEAAMGKECRVMLNNESYYFDSPRGIEDGETVFYQYYDGIVDELYVTFRVSEDPRFVRKGCHLFSRIDIDLYHAILGGYVIVETLTGRVKVTIDPGTDNGKTIRLKGKGFPKPGVDDKFGDLYLTVNIILPKKLSEEETKLFRRLATLRGL